jgi:GMP synthase (glutamine-hydrolysing)
MDKIAVLDFGGQYSHLISRRIRDFGVYSEVLHSDINIQNLKRMNDLKGIILSGGAASVYDDSSPKSDKSILDLKIPLLGICYGHQFLSYLEEGEVIIGESGEFGISELKILKKSNLLNGLNNMEKVWMNHKDIVKKLPASYSVVASTIHSPIAVFENKQKKIFGVQFHPEVTHTKNGIKILANFVFSICKAKKEWKVTNILKNLDNEIKNTLGKKKAIIGLSGGVDSSTATILVNNAIGRNLTAVYIDTGLMRYRETEFIKETFSKFDITLKIINAQDRFFKGLKGITDPELKRKIIGKLFVDIFDEVSRKERAEFLIQGTIYSDRIESGITKYSSKIKSHHNVGGLPKNMKLTIYEPLKNLYKDEVRKIAKKMNIPREIIRRHVFPGPGIAVRIIGGVNKEKSEIVRKASKIIEEELEKARMYDKVWMAFAVLLPIKTVGIQGDARSYKYTIVVRVVESRDAMTANFVKIPYKILEKISTRITNEINQVNRVVYDISNKPPSTMEWE